MARFVVGTPLISLRSSVAFAQNPPRNDPQAVLATQGNCLPVTRPCPETRSRSPQCVIKPNVLATHNSKPRASKRFPTPLKSFAE